MESATAARYAEEKDVVTELLDAVVRKKKNRNETKLLFSSSLHRFSDRPLKGVALDAVKPNTPKRERPVFARALVNAGTPMDG